jgi:hypothetical protein
VVAHVRVGLFERVGQVDAATDTAACGSDMETLQ